MSYDLVLASIDRAAGHAAIVGVLVVIGGLGAAVYFLRRRGR